MTVILKDTDRGNEREFKSIEEAKDRKQELIAVGADKDDLEIVEEDSSEQAESETEVQPVEPEPVETVDGTDNKRNPTATDSQPSEAMPAQMPVDTDPLDILPDYMIDKVKGEPTLNKRGLSVLAFHYGITVTDREILASPHESDWEYAIVETTIENADGNTFVGTGTAHVDRGDDKDVLLELAETRSYKRAVSFGTGTGIVSYQEMVGELE